MSVEAPTASAVCDACGAPVTGRFCASCGTRHKGPGAASGWRSAAEEYIGTEQPIGILKALAVVVTSPVKGPARLALDPEFRSHFAFFGMMLSIAIFTSYVGVPRVLGYFLGQKPATSNELASAEVVLHYVFVAIFMPVSFLLLQAAAAVTRRPYAYLKLWLIGAGATMLMQFLFMVATPALLIAGGLVTALLGFGYQWLPAGWVTLQVIQWFAVSIYAGLMAAEFWQLPRAWCIALFLMISVVIEEFLREPGMQLIRQVLQFWT